MLCKHFKSNFCVFSIQCTTCSYYSYTVFIFTKEVKSENTDVPVSFSQTFKELDMSEMFFMFSHFMETLFIKEHRP